MIKLFIPRVASLAVLPLISTWALADADLYGKANVSFQNSDDGSGSTTEVRSNASRLGVKGSETLDGGLTAIYQFEFQVAVDDGDNDGSTFSQRNIFVGLQGEMGTVKLGKFDTPLKSAQNKIDLFNDLEGDIANLITVNDNRPDNVLAYTSPEAPVVFNVAYISSEDDAVDNGLSASVAYTQDQLYLALAVDKDVEAPGSEAVRAVVQYRLNDWQFGGLLEESDDGFGSESGYLVSAKYQLEEWALKAQFGTSDIDESGAEALSLGADYKLARPVKLFGFVTTLESDEGTDEAYTGVGIEYKF